MARQKLTSTADASKLSSIKDVKEAALRGGLHMSAAGVAVVLLGGTEERQIEQTRIEIVKQMLSTATDDEKTATLRGAKAKEKIMLEDDPSKADPSQPINYGPLVVELCRLGMALGTAKSRASEMRTIAAAYPNGDGIDIEHGWHGTIADARQKKKDGKVAEAAHELALARRTLLGEGLEKFGNAEQAQEYAEEELAKMAEREEEKALIVKRDKLIEDTIKTYSDDDLRIIATNIAARIGFKLEKMTKDERKEAQTNINVAPAMAERGKAAASVHH